MAIVDYSVAPQAIRRGSWLWANRQGVIGGTIVLAAIVMAVAAPLLAPHDPSRGDLVARFTPPMWMDGGSPDYLLGTDQQGRDVLSRIIWGARISILVGVFAVLVSGTVGVAMGLVAGYYGGLADTVITRIVDIQLSFPFLALAVTAAAVLGAGVVNTILILGIAGWVLYARVVRAEVLSLREREYVVATLALGATDLRLLLRHILPNVLSPVIVIATFAFAFMIITEASLTFLGLGVPPPTAAWGRMMADARSYLTIAPWVAFGPGIALATLVLGVNMLGDWLRDTLDPTLDLRL